MKVKRFARVMALSLSLALAVPSVVPGAALTAEAAAKEVTLNKGSKKTLSVSTDKKVTWKSSKTKVATVSKKGVVKALKAGTTTITATYGSSKKTWKVTVPNIKLNQKSATIKVEGGTATDESQVQLRVLGLTAEQQQEVTWSVSDQTIAKLEMNNNTFVTSRAMITGKKPGTVTVTAKVGNVKLTCEVTVVKGGDTHSPDVYPVVPYTYTQNTKKTGDDVTVNALGMTYAGYQDVTALSKLELAYNPYADFFYTYNLKIGGSAQTAVKNPYDEAGKADAITGAKKVTLTVKVTGDVDSFWYMPNGQTEEVSWEDYTTQVVKQFGFLKKNLDGNDTATFTVLCTNGAFTFERAIMTTKPITEFVILKAVPDTIDAAH